MISNELHLGAIPLSPDILGKANIGLWAFELDEGDAPRMYVDDTMLGLLGLEHQVSPEETYHAWYDYVDEESYPLVNDAVDKMMTEHAEVQYPWHHPDGRTIIVRCGGVRNPKYTKGIRIEGTHQNVTEVLHYEEKTLKQLKEQSIELLKSKLRADALAFLADHEPNVQTFLDFFGPRVLEVSGGDQVIFWNKEGMRKVYNAPGIKDIPKETCSDCPFASLDSDAYGSDGCVLINDSRVGCNGFHAPKACPSKSTLMQRVNAGGNTVGVMAVHYLNECHTFTEDGIDILKTICIYLGLLLERIYAKEEITRQHQEKEKKILEPFLSSYSIVYRIRLSDGAFHLIKLEDGVIEKGATFADFDQAKDYFVNKVAYELDRDMLRQELDLDSIVKKLETSLNCTIEYRAMVHGVAIWHEMVFARLNSDEIAIGHKEKDADILNANINKAMMENYEDFYVVNLNTDQMKILKTKAVGKGKPQVVRFSEFTREFASRLSDEDKPYFESRMDLEALKRYLKNEGKQEYIYASPYYGDEPVWMKSEVHALGWRDGMPDTAVICASRVDAIQKERLALAEQLKSALRKSQEDNETIAEQAAFTSFFLEPYLSAYYIDLITMSCQIYKRTEALEHDYPVISNYLVTLNEYIDRDVHPDDREELRKKIGPDQMRAVLREQGELTHVFRDISYGKEKTYFMQVIRGADEEHAAFGFRDITEEKFEEERQKRIIQEAYDKAKEASLRNDIILKLAKAGKWSYGINENDEVVSAQYADETLQALSDTFPDKPMAWVDFIHPEDREKVAADFMAAIHDHTGNTPYDVTFRIIDKDGEYRWGKSTGQLIRHEDGTAELFGMNIEITEQILQQQEQQKQIADALERAKKEAERMQFVLHFSHANQWTYYIDSNDKVVSVDYSDRLGRVINQKQESDPMAWADHLHPDDKERVLENFMAAIRDHSCQTPYDSSFRIKSIDGSYYWGKSMGKLIRHEDGTAELFGMSININDQIVEQERMQNQLKEALESAQSANRAKTLFLNSMSHDIRTPMNAIIGYTSMTQKYIDEREKALGYLGKISTAGSNLLELINQVLDMSRIESGTVVLAEEPVDIIARGNEIIEIVESAAEAKNIALSTNINNIKDRKVFADPGRMNQLMLNILGNAIKYTPEGGHIRHTVTQSDCDKPGYATYVIMTEDTGIGMSKEYLATIYEPFSREKTSTVSKIQGSGLGMAIVKRLVDLMGGTIDIESEPGKGTKITLTLSFKLQEKKKTRSVEQIIMPAAYTNMFKGKRTLLVEDNEMNREIAKMILEEHGLIVETAEDGDIAVAMMKELAEKKDWNHFDFVLMDVQMPTMDGYEATKAIRAISAPEGVHIPIIAMTANAFAEDRQLALDAGMNEHIAKPLDVDQLWTTLAKFL